jgi:hypothetical protein
MKHNLYDIITTEEDPEELFQLLEKLGKKLDKIIRTGKLWECL